MLGAFNEFHVTNLSRETRKGKRQRAKEGKSIASVTAYAYRRDGTREDIPDPETRQAVVLALESYAPIGFNTFKDPNPATTVAISTTDAPPAPVPGAVSPNHVLKLDLSVVSWAGFAHFFENATVTPWTWVSQDWSAHEGISFWLYGNNSGTVLPSLANPWLARHLLSRFFRADAGRCNHCGLCARLCPMGNITVGKDTPPVWGRHCLFCATCELMCPEEAVESPLDSPVMERVMDLVAGQVLKDPTVDHARVALRRGRIERIDGQS